MSDPVTETTPPHHEPWSARAAALIRRLGPAGPFALAVMALPVVGGAVLLGTVKEWAPWCRAHATGGGPLMITLAGAMLSGTSLLPTYAVTILAGWSLGFRVGMPVACAAHALAGVVGFGLARAIGGDGILRAAHDHPKADVVRQTLVGRGFAPAALIVGLIRLAPIAPFGVTNLLAASSGCPAGAFIVGSTLGIVPQTALLAWVASRMARLSFRQEPWMLILSVAASAIVVLLLTAISRHALKRMTRASAAPDA